MFITVDSFSDSIAFCSLNFVHCLSLNIGGLFGRYSGKRERLQKLIERTKSKIICLQEWQVHRNSVSMFPLNWMRSYAKHATNNSTAIMYHKSLKTCINEFNAISLDKDLEHFWTIIIITMKDGMNVYIISYYRSPHGNYKRQFNDLMQKLKSLKNRIQENGAIIINGDFNAKHVQWYSTETRREGTYLYDCILNNNLDLTFDVLNVPGCITIYRKNCPPDVLDLTLAEPAILPYIKDWRTYHNRTSYFVPEHCAYRFTLLNTMDLRLHQLPPRWDFQHANWDVWREELRQQLLQTTALLDQCNNPGARDLDDFVDSFNNALLTASSQHIPITYAPIQYTLQHDATYQSFYQQVKDVLKRTKKLKSKFARQLHQTAPTTLHHTLNWCRRQKRRHRNHVAKQKIQSWKPVTVLNDSISYDNNNLVRLFWRQWNAITFTTASDQPPP